MRAFLAVFSLSLALIATSLGVGAQPVTFSGQITGTHPSMWVSPGILADGGTAFDSPMSTLGVTTPSNTGICASSARATAPGRNQLCMGATGNGGQISLQNYGTTPPGSMAFVVNGTSFNFPLGAITTNSPLLPNSQTTNYTIQTSDCGGAVIMTAANKTITLPSPSGFVGGCVVVVYNGNATSPQTLSGFPSPPPTSVPFFPQVCANCLQPGQSIQIWNANGAWNLLRPQITNPPMFNVELSNGNCAAAVGNGIADDTTAIQCQANYMQTTFGGGMLWFPAGPYLISSTITGPNNVIFQGSGQGNTTITSNNTDIIMFNFPSSVVGGGLRDLNIVGSLSTSATQNVVVVQSAAYVVMSYLYVTGGLFAFQEGGVNNVIEHISFSGKGLNGGSMISTGANTFIDDYFDNSGVTTKWGALINPTGFGTGENHFIHCDFSGTYSVGSLEVAGNGFVTIFGAIFSSSVKIDASNSWTGITGSWFGTGTVTNASPLTITDSTVVGGGTMTVTGTGLRNCAGNIAIFCGGTTATMQASAGNPAGTISSASRMTGIGSTCTITPLFGSRAVITIGGNVQNTTAGDGAQLNLYYGSGPAPANGAATTGTLTTASAALGVSAGNSLAVPFNLGSVVVTGLTPGTAYWFDLALAVITGGTASATGVWCSAFELS